MVVLFNATDEPQTHTDPSYVDAPLELHPVLQSSVDPVVGTTTFDPVTGTFEVPARTAVVFGDLGPDVTPPDIEAELHRIRRIGRHGIFRVDISCTDDRGAVTTIADVNGAPVDDGDLLFLIQHRRKDKVLSLPFITFIWGASFELTVTCTDEAGNSSTASTFADLPRPDRRRR
jgi:hypothetical protein